MNLPGDGIRTEGWSRVGFLFEGYGGSGGAAAPASYQKFTSQIELGKCLMAQSTFAQCR